MNDNFFSQMRDSLGWLMLDPVVPEHTTTVIGLGLVLGILSFRKMAESLGASNWTLPMAALSYVLGGAAMIAGIVGTDFQVISDSSRQTFVTVATGKVTVTGTKSGGQVEVGAGQTVNCPNGGSTTPPRKADDADLKAINSFKTAVGDATNQRNKQIESAL